MLVSKSNPEMIRSYHRDISKVALSRNVRADLSRFYVVLSPIAPLSSRDGTMA